MLGRCGEYWRQRLVGRGDQRSPQPYCRVGRGDPLEPSAVPLGAAGHILYGLVEVRRLHDHVDVLQDSLEAQVDGEQQPVAPSRPGVCVLAVDLHELAEDIGPHGTVADDLGLTEVVEPRWQLGRIAATVSAGGRRPVGKPASRQVGRLGQPHRAGRRHRL